MSERELVVKGLQAGKYTAIFKPVAQLLSLVLLVVLVRVLDEHEYGIYSLLYSMIALISVFLSFGLANTLQRYVPELYKQQEYYLANKLYRVCSAIRLLTNVFTLAIVLALWDVLAPALKLAEYKPYFYLFAVVVVLHLQKEILELCINSFLLQQYSQPILVAFNLIKLIGYSFGLYYQIDLWTVIAIDIFAYAVCFIFLQYYYTNRVSSVLPGRRKFTHDERKRILKYAFFYNFNDSGVGLLGSDVDNYLIALYLDPVAVGAYAFANKFNKLVVAATPLKFFIDVIRPLFFHINVNAVDKIRSNYVLLAKITYMVYMPILIFLIVLCEKMMVVLFDSKFIEYAYVIPAIFFFLTINAFQVPLGLVAQLKERADIILYSKLFGVLNIALALVLIPQHGIFGAVIATGVSVLFKNIFILFFFRRETSLSGHWFGFIRLNVFWAFAGVMLWYALGAIAEVWSLVFGAAAILIFALISISLGCFSQNELSYLRDNFPRKFVFWRFKNWIPWAK